MQRLQDAGVPEQHAVAMLYAAIRASDAKFDDLRRENAREFAALRTDIDAKFAALDAKFEAIDKRFEALDTRIGTLDIKIDSVSTALGAKIEALDIKIDGVSIGLGGRLDGLDSKITAVRWRLVIIGGAVGGILAVLASALPDIVAAFR